MNEMLCSWSKWVITTCEDENNIKTKHIQRKNYLWVKVNWCHDAPVVWKCLTNFHPLCDTDEEAARYNSKDHYIDHRDDDKSSRRRFVIEVPFVKYVCAAVRYRMT